MDIKENLKEFAYKYGIDKIGFCNTEPFYNVKKVLQDRAEANELSGFEEKDIEKRINPRLTMENAKTIIVIAENYNREFSYEKDNQLRGKISLCAIGEDYHTVLKRRLQMIGEYIKSLEPKVEFVSFVDTGPLVDREVAKRAGIGWQGKNGAIITKEYGSWVFIGYMLINIEIEPDEPIDINCGSCDKCIKACPTKALRDNYGFCATNCISYLTQTKGVISIEQAHKMGNSIYGCDICQMVCPYNKGTYVKEKIENIELVEPKLEDILRLSNAEFKATYTKTAAGWRGKKILQRNAVIALGNSKHEMAKGLLKECLNDTREDIKKQAEEFLT